MLPWLLCAALAAAVAVLLAKLWLLRRGLDDMDRQLGERLDQDTNNPIFLSVRDRSARRLAQSLNLRLEQLRRQRQRYEAGDRALQEAVTGVSHDLRTPLTALEGYVELLEREALSPAAARYVGYIRDRARAMERLTEALLRTSLTGEEALTLEPVDLNAALEDSVASFYAALTARGIAPQVRMPQRRVIRQLDRAALGRVFENLLSNALKYSSSDLEITLSQSGAVVFANTAPGLDEVQTGRLFDRFYTVETARSSTGLGLSIARGLVGRMGGSLEASYLRGRLVVTVHF